MIIIMIMVITPQQILYASSFMFSNFPCPQHYNGEVSRGWLLNESAVAEFD